MYIRHFGLDPGDIEKLGGRGGQTGGGRDRGSRWEWSVLAANVFVLPDLGAKMRQYWRYWK